MGKLIFSGSYQPLDEQQISDFEARAKITLPPKYRSFLLRVNGGQPSKPLLPECYVQNVYAITNANEYMSLEQNIKLMEGALPHHMIPIGYASGGDQLCMSLLSEQIYLWEREKVYQCSPPALDEMVYVSKDINELMVKLEGDGDSAVVDEEISNIGRWGSVPLLNDYLKTHEINEVSASGKSIVRAAVYAENLDFVKECVRRGAVLNNRGVLHAAAFTMNVEMVKFLLDCGVDPNERNERGMTPLDVVLPSPEGGAVELLRRAGGVKTE